MPDSHTQTETTPRTSKTTKKILITAAAVIVVIIVLIVAFALWFYKTPLNPTKQKLAQKLPLPAALVNYHAVLLRDYFLRLDAAQTYYAQETAQASSTPNSQQPNPEELKQQVFNQLIQDKQTALVAARHNVTVSSTNMQDQLQEMKDEESEGGGDFEQELQAYGMTDAQFEKEILQPELLTINLNIWFNSQQSLNPKEYALADSIQQQLEQATSSTSTFASLVNKYSQDPDSKQTNGDLGFLQEAGILPEFDVLFASSTQPGQVFIIPSRYGIHIFQILAKDNNGNGGATEVHAEEIFLNAEDFNSWMSSQTKNMSVKKLIKI